MNWAMPILKEKAQLACVVYTMCGIVGVVGNTNATDILVQGLEKLEYRGYDSGCILDGADNHLVKAVGRIAELSPSRQLVLRNNWYRTYSLGNSWKATEDNAHTPLRTETVLSWFTMG